MPSPLSLYPSLFFPISLSLAPSPYCFPSLFPSPALSLSRLRSPPLSLTLSISLCFSIELSVSLILPLPSPSLNISICACVRSFVSACVRKCVRATVKGLSSLCKQYFITYSNAFTTTRHDSLRFISLHVTVIR